MKQTPWDTGNHEVATLWFVVLVAVSSLPLPGQAALCCKHLCRCQPSNQNNQTTSSVQDVTAAAWLHNCWILFLSKLLVPKSAKTRMWMTTTCCCCGASSCFQPLICNDMTVRCFSPSSNQPFHWWGKHSDSRRHFIFPPVPVSMDVKHKATCVFLESVRTKNKNTVWISSHHRSRQELYITIRVLAASYRQYSSMYHHYSSG